MTNPDSKKAPSWSIKHLKSPVDGLKIRYADRPVPKAKLRVLFLNGRNEWIEKYEDLPGDTAFGNAHWVTMDHRGQGGSEGAKAHVNSYEDFVQDVAAVVQATFGEKDYLVIAHSMGGLIALYGTMKGTLHPTSLLLCSPLFGILTPMPLAMGKMLARLVSLTPLGTRATGAGSDRRANFVGNPLTHSQKRFEALVNGPYPAYTPTFTWVHASFRATALIFQAKYVKRLTIPVSVMVGSEEVVVDKAVFEQWFDRWKRLTGKKGRFEIIPGAGHELLNEDDRFRNQAIALLNEWIKL